jgi:hypothetical protein
MPNCCSACGEKLKHSPSAIEGLLGKQAFRFAGQSHSFPPSSLCSDCRHQRRLAFRNERSLYHRFSAATGERILSLYHERPLWGEAYQVLTEEQWRSETFNPFDYGREIDFSRSFFEQYSELHKAVPRMSIVNLQNENSPYTSHTGYSRNCYLLPCSENCEDCYYGRFLQSCKSCLDCTSATKCELCFESFQIANCYNCAFLSLSEGCSECYFSEGLVGCRSCLFCTNLRQGEYQIYNKPVSKAEFESRKEELLSSAENTARARAEWERIRLARAHRPANIRNCEDCSGDFLLDSRGCVGCQDVTGCEDCRDVLIGYKLKDTYSSSNIYLDCELCYEILGSAQLYHCAFGFYVFRSRDVIYSEYIYDSEDLFGCVGLTRAKNCILNRQYSASEYQQLAARLVEHMQSTGEWGQFLPSKFSPFGYNETAASDFKPLTRDQALAAGFLWRDLDQRELASVTKEQPPGRVADISQTSLESLAKEVFRCQESGEPYKIIKPELEFYREHGFALPRYSPRTRHLKREALRFPPVFRRGHCQACQSEVETNLPFELESTLRCERCYQEMF